MGRFKGGAAVVDDRPNGALSAEAAKRADAIVAAAERRAREIVREAEQEAFLILEQAATVAFKGSGPQSAAARGARVGKHLLAFGSFGLAVLAVVEMAAGRL